MQRRVLLIGGNFYPEPIGIGKYNGEMIDWLAQNGYDCTVVTSYPYYPQWKVQQPYVKKSHWYRKEVKYYKPYYEKNISIYRCPQYVPGIPTGTKRMLNGFSFFMSSLLVVVKLLFKKKYDYVISVVPSFETGLLAILYKGIKGGKFLYHIQDLQIDAARDLNLIKSKPLISLLFRVEKFILKRADVVSSVSTGMMDKVKGKCDKKVQFFPNWVNSKVIYPMLNKAELKQEFGFSPNDKIILYSGAIGEKQGLDNIIYTAVSFLSEKDIKFIICGSGPYRKNLENLKEQLNVSNVVFMSTQPLDKLNHFLNMADLHLIVQKANATDLVMPSKLTNILAIGGLSVVTAVEGSSLHQLVTEHEVGIVVNPDDVLSLTIAIKDAVEHDYNNIRGNAISYAEQHFSITNIISKYSLQMEDIQNENLVESMEFHLKTSFSSMEAKV
jgi:colanic acid biosynthesis glycosyl transferase WcaI